MTDPLTFEAASRLRFLQTVDEILAYLHDHADEFSDAVDFPGAVDNLIEARGIAAELLTQLGHGDKVKPPPQ